jgi:CheY-like chemotaxis protein
MSVDRARKYRILVVDDQEMVRDCILMLLSHDGHEVETASGGPNALALYNRSEFDLVFTDYSMPVMKGDELAASIKARAPDQPIVLVTADAELLRVSGTVPASVDWLVQKPFTLDDLRRAIHQVMAEKTIVE